MKKSGLENVIADYAITYKEDLYRLAYSYVKNIDDALDIIHESIYKATSSMDSLKNPDYIKTWFYRIVINTSLDFLRKRSKFIVTDEETMSGLDLGTADNYQDIDLKRALDCLPYNYRIVIILRYFEDLKIEEIAEILNKNVNTVKTHLYKALEKLRIEMDDSVKEEYDDRQKIRAIEE